MSFQPTVSFGDLQKCHLSHDRRGPRDPGLISEVSVTFQDDITQVIPKGWIEAGMNGATVRATAVAVVDP